MKKNCENEGMFQDKVVVLTGGAGSIGRCIYDQFPQSLAIGITALFYLAKLFASYMAGHINSFIK